MMGEEAYARARKQGLKEYHNRMQRRQSPFLPVLEEMEEQLNALSHVPLGLVQIPLKKVVGTASKGRTNAFAANFMPILDPGSEFSVKWSLLYEGIVAQGLNQPVKVLEYLNQYYLIEGNKRVSVMKFLDSISIEAEVTRVLPKRSDAPENVLYYELLPFYADTGINYLWFSKPGSVAKLYELTGRTPGEKWSSEERSDFNAAFMRFRAEYKAREAGSDAKKLPVTTGDAFLIYLEACGYADAPKKFEQQLRGEVKALWGEFEKDKEAENVALIMKPDELKQGGGLLNTLFGPSKVKVAFMYTREPSQSGWTYWHDLGRINMENDMGERVKTTVCVCETPDSYEAEIERLIAEGNNLIFTTSPLMLSASMKASVKHPDAKLLNCSLLASWQRVRSYYVRLYEVKFLIGMIAGALTENDKVGYIGDYPIAGVAANINAFALGARMVNPRVKVILEWSTRKDFNPENPFGDPSVEIISSRDVGAPSHHAVEYGLYAQRGDTKQSIAIPVLDWSRIYESLARSVLNGSWKDVGAGQPKAVNYWWGLSSDAVDIVMSQRMDIGLKRLVELVKEHIREGVFWPFESIIRDQAGEIRCPVDGRLTPADVIAMDWLVDNVVGGFPAIDDLKDETRALVELQGIKEISLPAASAFSWRAEEA
ncbi:MAG: BMP family ABC transporter substrate-binding protein [Clostridia bacterium]|nr:BMP family ABC transporter substrate-binding protein [Clostridia bacterium]